MTETRRNNKLKELKFIFSFFLKGKTKIDITKKSLFFSCLLPFFLLLFLIFLFNFTQTTIFFPLNNFIKTKKDNFLIF